MLTKGRNKVLYYESWRKESSERFSSMRKEMRGESEDQEMKLDFWVIRARIEEKCLWLWWERKEEGKTNLIQFSLQTNQQEPVHCCKQRQRGESWGRSKKCSWKMWEMRTKGWMWGKERASPAERGETTYMWRKWSWSRPGNCTDRRPRQDNLEEDPGSRIDPSSSLTCKRSLNLF